MTKATDTHTVDYWREAQGGFRGSHLLQGGAALLAAGAVLSLAALLLAGTGREPHSGLVVTGWLAYVLGLGGVGLGFGWTCAAGILPRAGLLAAGLHLAQAAYLLIVLYGRNVPPLSPVTLTAGRLLALLLLAVLAAPRLGRRTALALGGAAGLSLGKALLRVLAPRADGGAVLDSLVLLALAAALSLTARRLRRIEDDWARGHHPGGRTDFSEFNNPQHDWNKPGNSLHSACAGAVR